MTITEVLPAVRLRDVAKTYGSVRALDGVTIDFAPGAFTAIMGPSGSGKSTLLQCMAGLDRPTRGEIVIGGTGTAGLSEKELTLLRRDRIGFIFQSYNLVSALTAEQNIALPLRLAGRRPSTGQVAAALGEVGLADRGDHKPSQLSGGEQQRVAIARALITRPAVVLADEPTGSLDIRKSRDLLRLLRETVDTHGQTVVMVTHDPVCASYADRVIFLADGRAVDEAVPPFGIEAIAARMTRLEGRDA